MDSDRTIEQSKERGWVWAILFVAIGAINIADWLYGARTNTYHFLFGLGFLLVAPQAFLHPIRLTAPLRGQFKIKPRASTPIDWLAIAGIVLLVSGLVVRWL